jgi:hypothetical protein
VSTGVGEFHSTVSYATRARIGVGGEVFRSALSRVCNMGPTEKANPRLLNSWCSGCDEVGSFS